MSFYLDPWNGTLVPCRTNKECQVEDHFHLGFCETFTNNSSGEHVGWFCSCTYYYARMGSACKDLAPRGTSMALLQTSVMLVLAIGLVKTILNVRHTYKLKVLGWRLKLLVSVSTVFGQTALTTWAGCASLVWFGVIHHHISVNVLAAISAGLGCIVLSTCSLLWNRVIMEAKKPKNAATIERRLQLAAGLFNFVITVGISYLAAMNQILSALHFAVSMTFALSLVYVIQGFRMRRLIYELNLKVVNSAVHRVTTQVMLELQRVIIKLALCMIGVIVFAAIYSITAYMPIPARPFYIHVSSVFGIQLCTSVGVIAISNYTASTRGTSKSTRVQHAPAKAASSTETTRPCSKTT